MVEIRSSETLGSLWITRHYNPEQSSHHTLWESQLKSNFIAFRNEPQIPFNTV
jgi:hypothetical protein